MQHRPRISNFSFPSRRFGSRNRRWVHAGLVLFLSLLFSTLAVAQSCSVNISTNPSSPVPPGQSVTVNASVTSGRFRTIGGGGLITADVALDGASICSSFSDSCTTTVGPLSPGSHSLDWSCMDTDTGGSNSGFQSIDVSSGGGRADIFPNYFVLSVIYAAPGNKSSAGFTQSASFGVTTSLTKTFAAGTSLTFTGTKTGGVLSGTSGGATFQITKAISLSEALSETITSTGGSQVLSSDDFVNHYQDRIFLWLNPVFTVTQTGPHSGNFTVGTPIGPDGKPEIMDILDFSVADLLNPSQIPLEKLQSRLVNGATLPGLGNVCAHPLPAEQCTVTNACGCQASDFATILKQDPLVFPIIGSNGQIVSPNDAPSSVDASRFLSINQGGLFLPGVAPEVNTYEISDS